MVALPAVVARRNPINFLVQFKLMEIIIHYNYSRRRRRSRLTVLIRLNFFSDPAAYLVLIAMLSHVV